MLVLLGIAVAVANRSADRPRLDRDPNRFPIAVWLQSPANARRYREIGINLYVGLWGGPTENQIKELEAAGMPVVCELNGWARANLGRRIVVGWMHGDEPDNAQPLPDGKGYGPPIAPEKVVKGFEQIRRTDPSRPVLLNLGQGVAWEGWYGRGERTGRLEDYPRYVKGADIVSFDVYPVTHKNDAVRGKLGMVGIGTRRLREWTEAGQAVWACVEATHVDNADVAPTPEQTRAMAWMAIVHGATGLIYFSHQFAPKFVEAGILADDRVAKGVKATNEEISRLAPILNAPTVQVTVEGNAAALAKRRAGGTYVFAVATSPRPTVATIHVGGVKGRRQVEVVGSATTLPSKDGVFKDSLGPYEVRRYRIR